jgi:hypothetical protein
MRISVTWRALAKRTSPEAPDSAAPSAPTLGLMGERNNQVQVQERLAFLPMLWL